MPQPNVTTYALAAASATALVNASATVAANVPFVLVTTVLDNQRRILFTPSANESSNTFAIVGTNGAGFPITENLAGANATTFYSNLDFKTVTKITPLVTTVGTVSIGTNGVGSTLWNIVDWALTPTNIELSVVVQTGTGNYNAQYTYDDPNKLPAGVTYPQPFNHPTLSGTATLDGPVNDPVLGVRLLVNSGTGTFRFTVTQAGLASP